jgi:alkylation response protein AidB-like acyl-CoA dehydrogenase
VHFAFSDDQVAFRDAVADFLAKECPPSVVRQAWDGQPVDLWRPLAEMGVVGLTVPEAAGGLGLGMLDLVLLLEETGRAALPEPIVETTAVCAPLLDDEWGARVRWWCCTIPGARPGPTGPTSCWSRATATAACRRPTRPR